MAQPPIQQVNGQAGPLQSSIQPQSSGEQSLQLDSSVASTRGYIWVSYLVPLSHWWGIGHIRNGLGERSTNSSFQLFVVELRWFRSSMLPSHFDKIALMDSPTNIILTGAMTAVLANSYIAKRYPKVHSQYIYVIR
jgi:hypothetical protein